LDGLGLLAQARSIDRDLAVILITGHGDVAMAVNAMRLGPYDFVEKPFPPDRSVEMASVLIEDAWPSTTAMHHWCVSLWGFPSGPFTTRFGSSAFRLKNSTLRTRGRRS
jgi:ActR/RegA family two-component response regulator